MSAEEKKILENLAKNIDAIPEEKREYLMGIGEGLRLAKRKAAETVEAKGEEK